MFKFSKRRVLALGALLTLAVTGAALAYWTGGGSGTGTASAGTTSVLKVNQTSTLTAMYPGDSAQTLSGNFDNPNSGPVYVTSVTASINKVTQATGAVGSCDASDFTLSNATMNVGTEVAAGDGKGAWSGATIKFNNKTTNQDGCKNATVELAYSVL